MNTTSTYRSAYAVQARLTLQHPTMLTITHRALMQINAHRLYAALSQ